MLRSREGSGARRAGRGTNRPTLLRARRCGYNFRMNQPHEDRFRRGEFTFDDFRKLMWQTQKLGSLNKIMSQIPGMEQVTEVIDDYNAEADLRRLCGIIDSMTLDERRGPTRSIDQGRCRRIAAGAGVEVAEVNSLVKQCAGMAKIVAGKGRPRG
jgi:signal recognition particle subunit SRP54